MAVEFNAPSLTRTSEYLIDPREITVKPELNGRHELPDIEDIVEGFLHIGQTTPVLIGRDGRTPVLYAGHRRWRAALHITKEKLLPNGVPFKLRCVYFQGDERTAFLATISENNDRKNATEIDDAYNIVKLRRWNMTDEEIAVIYRKKTGDGKPDTSWVAKRASLIDLCDEAVEALKSGRMKPTAAVAIAKLAKDAQRERIAAAVSSGAKHITAKPAAPAAALKTGSDAETVADFRAAERKIKNVTDFRNLVQEYIDMDIPERIKGFTCENAVRKILSDLLDELR